MRYELRRPHELTPFDDMVSATPGGVIVAVPETTVDAIVNLVAAGFTIEGIESFDDASNVR